MGTCEHGIYIGLPRTRILHDSIWVIIDRMIKSAHFIPVKISFLGEDYAKLYIREMVKLHEFLYLLFTIGILNILLLSEVIRKKAWF